MLVGTDAAAASTLVEAMMRLMAMHLMAMVLYAAALLVGFGHFLVFFLDGIFDLAAVSLVLGVMFMTMCHHAPPMVAPYYTLEN